VASPCRDSDARISRLCGRRGDLRAERRIRDAPGERSRHAATVVPDDACHPANAASNLEHDDEHLDRREVVDDDQTSQTNDDDEHFDDDDDDNYDNNPGASEDDPDRPGTRRGGKRQWAAEPGDAGVLRALECRL
jgi:hypothetical protein